MTEAPREASVVPGKRARSEATDDAEVLVAVGSVEDEDSQEITEAADEDVEDAVEIDDASGVEDAAELDALDASDDGDDTSDDSEEPADPVTTPLRSASPKLPARATSSALGPVDTLSAYMAQLGHHAPITREAEHALALRWVEDQDVDAARQLVLANLRLVVKIAMEYRRAWTNVLDLIQEGNIGLLEAVQRYDPYQGVKLSSYAVYWIRAYILQYILDNFRIVRLGTTRNQRKLFWRLNKEKRQLEREGFEVEPRMLAERLDVSEAEVEDMEMRLRESDQSMNAPLRRDEPGAEFGDFMRSAGDSAEQSFGDTELRRVFLEQVSHFAETLDERDQRLIEARVLAEEPMTLAELGEEFGVSRERVRQLEVRIVERLREYLKENLVDFEYYAAPSED